jgi:phage terminase Nu1 subunit (DNA packaging protein)
MAEGKTATQSVGTIAKLLILTEQRVQQLTQEGVIPKVARGKYELVGAVHGYIKYLRDRAVGADLPDSVGDSKSRILRAKAEMAEREAKEKSGKLVDVEQMILVVTSIVMRMRTRLLAIPVKAAPLVAVEAEIEPCRAIIETLVHEALAELSSTDPRLVGVAWDRAPGARDAASGEAAAEAEHQPVGGSKAKAVG